MSSGDLAWRKPTTGIAGRCARAASGQATAVLPSSAMNLRRLMQNCPSRTKPTKGQRCASQQNWPPNAAMGHFRQDWVARVSRGMSASLGGFNRSTQHLLILLDWEVSDGGECTDVVHAETAGRALGAMEERSMCGGHRPSA